jgi:hypothetical protein
MLRTKRTVQRCHGALHRAGDRALAALVVVGHDEPDALQAARLQRAQELQPEGLGLDLAEVQADDLAPTAVMDGVGDHQRLGHHAAVVADLDVLGV